MAGRRWRGGVVVAFSAVVPGLGELPPAGPAVRGWSVAGGGGPEVGALLRRVPARVGVDDVGDQPVPHDIGAGQLREVHVIDVGEDLAHDVQAGAHAGGQVDLGDVAGDHDLRPEA